MPVTPAEPIGMSMPPTTPGFTAIGGAAAGVGCGGVSDPFLVERPKLENGTVFGSGFATGFGGSATGSAIATFFGADGVTGCDITAGGATDAVGATNLMFSVETS